MPKAQKFDAADYLDSKEAIADYLSEAFAAGNNDLIAKAIGTVARVRPVGWVSAAGA